MSRFLGKSILVASVVGGFCLLGSAVASAQTPATSATEMSTGTTTVANLSAAASGTNSYAVKDSAPVRANTKSASNTDTFGNGGNTTAVDLGVVLGINLEGDGNNGNGSTVGGNQGAGNTVSQGNLGLDLGLNLGANVGHSSSDTESSGTQARLEANLEANLNSNNDGQGSANLL